MTLRRPNPRAALPVLRDVMPDFDDRPTMPADLIAEPLQVPVGEAHELPDREGRELFLKAWQRQQGGA